MKQTINLIFIWLLRAGLVGAAVYCALKPDFPDKKEIVGGLFTAVVCSFWLLDTDS